MSSGERVASAIGVDRLQPGDHAFLAFGDDEERWEILSVFTRQGITRDEKVVLNVDTTASAAEVAMLVAGEAAARVLDSGQLVVSTAPRFGPGQFDAGRMVDATRRKVDAVISEGYSGLRSTSEMSFALAPVDNLNQAVEYEIALHQTMFTGHRDRRYTALCQWDTRRFAGEPAMQAARDVHPVTILGRLGTLHIALIPGGIKLTGDADLATRAEFTGALRTLAGHPADVLVLDITDLSFLDAYSSGAVMRLAAGLQAPRRLEVRCRAAQRRMLRAIGAQTVERLSVVTERL
jgi:MEDS: MEthanogen/methylotroph, DcmR Sensory domain